MTEYVDCEAAEFMALSFDAVGVKATTEIIQGKQVQD